MKIAHVLVPHFPVQVEILHDPSLRRKPIVIGGQPDSGGRVYACSPAAQRGGIETGISLRQAEQLVPGAIFLTIEESRYAEAQAGLIRCLSKFSPLRQTLEPGEVSIEASGLEGLYGPDLQLLDRLCAEVREDTGLIPQVGLAANRFTAATASRLAKLGTGVMVPLGEEADYLAPLPIRALPLSEEAEQLLTRLGVLTLGKVAELPAGALSRALGREGDRLHRLARGADLSPLIPEFEETPLSARLTLDFQLEYLPALVAYVDLLVSELAAELIDSGLVSGAIVLTVEQEDGARLTTWGYLRPASCDRRAMTDRAAGLLERLDYTAGVNLLEITLTPLHAYHEDSQQLPFGRRYGLTPDPVGHALRTIRERYGGEAIRAAARISGPPPEPVEVRTEGGEAPVAMLRGGRWTWIETVQLHWRLEGEWWWQEGRKDYFQVVTRGGEILTLLYVSPQGRWYVHPAAKPSQWPILKGHDHP